MVVMWEKLVDGKKVDEMEILMAAWTECNAVGKMAFPCEGVKVSCLACAMGNGKVDVKARKWVDW